MQSCSVTNNTTLFGNCLSGLSLLQLLQLKSSLNKMTESDETCGTKNQLTSNTEEDLLTPDSAGPVAMALISNERSYSSYSDYHPWKIEMEEKPSKLQTLFQISITALTFLAFGGYLLCLIVQAIKSKGTTYFHPVATATTTYANGGVKRIKIYRRSRRSISSVSSAQPYLMLVEKYDNSLFFGNYLMKEQISQHPEYNSKI